MICPKISAEQHKKIIGKKNNFKAEIYSKELNILDITEGLVTPEDNHYAFSKQNFK